MKCERCEGLMLEEEIMVSGDSLKSEGPYPLVTVLTAGGLSTEPSSIRMLFKRRQTHHLPFLSPRHSSCVCPLFFLSYKPRQ